MTIKALQPYSRPGAPLRAPGAHLTPVAEPRALLRGKAAAPERRTCRQLTAMFQVQRCFMPVAAF